MGLPAGLILEQFGPKLASLLALIIATTGFTGFYLALIYPKEFGTSLFWLLVSSLFVEGKFSLRIGLQMTKESHKRQTFWQDFCWQNEFENEYLFGTVPIYNFRIQWKISIINRFLSIACLLIANTDFTRSMISSNKPFRIFSGRTRCSSNVLEWRCSELV